jgi:limonene-1,2-epoxide hydrolase
VSGPGDAPTPKAVTGAFWAALYERDWERIRTFFGPESVYFDVPTGPSTAARGPDDIEARLRLGLETISGYEHHPGPVVSEGPVVMTEHTEVWHWSSGESVALPFVSVQYVEHGVITMWKDYWDYKTLLDAAPADWQERLFTADLSWIHDATGHPLA